MSQPRPKVSIGLPVFNGQNYLGQAVDSILSQTFTDFELVICDNASTDDTELIARDYAARDRRVRYHRHDTNLGPYRNFEFALEASRGEYFKWAAHDDVLSPGFLAQCVDVLDADPEVVLCQSLVSIIDMEGRELAVYDSGLLGAGSSSASERFASLVLVPHVCTEMFGLYRPGALKKTRLFSGRYHGCDRAMLAELALVGRFAQVAAPLFMNREHADRYVRAVSPKDRSAYAHVPRRRKVELSSWYLFSDYLAAIRRHVRGRGERIRCYGHLVHWWLVAWNSLRFGAELVSLVFPDFYGFAKEAKDRLVQPVHPTITGRGAGG